MSVLDEAKDIVDDKFETKRPEVYQEFSVVVRVFPGDKNPETVRQLLDEVSKQFDGFILANETGSLQIVNVTPK